MPTDTLRSSDMACVSLLRSRRLLLAQRVALALLVVGDYLLRKRHVVVHDVVARRGLHGEAGVPHPVIHTAR